MAHRYSHFGSNRVFRNNGRNEGTGAEGRVGNNNNLQPDLIPELELDERWKQATISDYMNLRPINLMERRVPRASYDGVHRQFTSGKEYRNAVAQLQTLTTTGNLTVLNGKQVIALTDPYANPSFQKARLEDAYRLDPIIRRGINLIVKFLLGRRTKTIVSTIAEFINTSTTETSPAEQITALTLQQNNANPFGAGPVDGTDPAQALEQIDAQIPQTKPQPKEGMLSDKEADDLKEKIEQVNRRCKFHQKLKGALVQALVGGRACLLIEGTNPDDNMPQDLKLLNWKRLGRVFIDPDDWSLVGVEYLDHRGLRVLMADDIIYLTMQDFHVSPDTLFYGLSLIEPVIDISEANRLLDQMDFKEANRSA